MKNHVKLLYILTVVKIILPFLLQDASYQPHRDEFLYLAEGQHLAWGYMEVPPLLSVFAWLTHLFGGSMFWIKFWPSLFGGLTFFLTGKIIISLGGRAFAVWLAFLPFALDGYLRLFFLFQPNFLEVFFWTAIAFSIIQYIQTNKNKWLYYCGLCVGLGLMSKYSVAFYTISILAGLVMTPQRKIFANKHLYFAAIIAIIIFLPNIIWQYNHLFPVLHHMKELQETQLQYINRPAFIIDQFMMNLPCVFIWIAGLLTLFFSSSLRAYRFIAWAYLFVIILLLYLQGKSYYALGAYPVLFAFGAFQLEKITSKRFRWTRFAMILFPVALGLFSLPLVLPIAKPEKLANYYQKTGMNKTGDFKWEDLKTHPLPQDFADMIGWKELAKKVAAVYSTLPSEQKQSIFIYCRGYYSAGALNYYGPSLGLPEAYSDDANFLWWLPDSSHSKNMLFIGHNIPKKDDLVFQQYEKYEIKDSVNMPLFRENGIKVVLFENGNDSLNTFINRSIAEQRAEFLRK
ncbi:glycosyltransferase family 39 protein [Danxiaibacter flavus]|uniref:Glycosyltransferase family 39 protein n=1 Tax=Danxiaibacter flavus TaxID=3049108 RepID=A0ABV3ZGE4_9BACT|nr:glycosyltransferase family 39 protein [Chitinophagaceae bacterium DXS]